MIAKRDKQQRATGTPVVPAEAKESALALGGIRLVCYMPGCAGCPKGYRYQQADLTVRTLHAKPPARLKGSAMCASTSYGALLESKSPCEDHSKRVI